MVIGASLVTWVAGLAARCPATVTRPAVTSSPACSRDLARPRLTSSASSRTRTVVKAGLGPVRLNGAVLALVELAQDVPELPVHLFEHGDVLVRRGARQAAQPGHGRVYPVVARRR